MDEIIAEYGAPGEASYRRVIVDRQAGKITFFRCHHRNRIWAIGPDAEYSCRLDQIRGLCATWVRPRHVGPVLEVVTPNGRARLPQTMRGFVPVRHILQEAVVRYGRRLPWYELSIIRELLVLVCGAAGGAALIGVLLAAPYWVSVLAIVATASVPLVVCALFWLSGRSLW